MTTYRLIDESGKCRHRIESGGRFAGRGDSNLHIGDVGIVEPENPKKLKHRGRECRITGYKEDRYGVRLQVKFSDNGRPGLIEIPDLRLSTPAESLHG